MVFSWWFSLPLQDFMVEYRPFGLSDWSHETVRENYLITLKNMIAHTNYSIRVTAEKDGRSMMSSLAYVYVRDGVPWPPYNLTYHVPADSNTTLDISWKGLDIYNTLAYQVELIQANHSRLASTKANFFTFTDVQDLHDWFQIRVYALNNVGRSLPASLEKIVSRVSARETGKNPDQQDEPRRHRVAVCKCLWGAMWSFTFGIRPGDEQGLCYLKISHHLSYLVNNNPFTLTINILYQISDHMITLLLVFKDSSYSNFLVHRVQIILKHSKHCINSAQWLYQKICKIWLT